MLFIGTLLVTLALCAVTQHQLCGNVTGVLADPPKDSEIRESARARTRARESESESESDKRALPASRRPAIYWAKYVYAKQTKGS